MSRASVQSETVLLAGHIVDLSRKRIKNLILRVSDAEGRLRLSIPRHCSLTQAEAFILSRRDWIEKQKRELAKRSAQLARRYENGEVTYLWGKPYILQVEGKRDGEEALFAFYREELARALDERLPIWQQKLELENVEWTIRKMKSRWGSCHPKKRKITINLHLARYPFELLDYLLVHELMHFHEASHNRRFYALMDQVIPDWKLRRKALRKPLPYEGESISSLREKIRENQSAQAGEALKLDVDKLCPLLII